MVRRVEVVIPGLAGGFSEIECQQADWSTHSYLVQRLLAKADKLPADKSPAIRAGFGTDFQYLLPVAMYEYRYYKQGGRGDQYCLYADPIYLEIKTDHAVLYDQAYSPVRETELEELAERFNQYFHDQGLKLEIAGGRWFLRSEQKPDTTMYPTGSAFGRNVKHFMPAGKNASFWLQVLNETQMLFHSSPVNEQRTSEGKPAISGLWFWGGGGGKLAHPEDITVYSQVTWVQGLCQAHNTPIYSLKYLPAISDISGDKIVVFDDRLLRAASTGDLFLWQKKMEEVENIILKPLLSALAKKQFDELVIHAGAHLFTYKHRHRYRIFRRKLPVNRICIGNI